MKNFYTNLKVTILALTFLFSALSYGQRIKDLADVAGVRSNQLVGYGLVVGLDGTGEKTKYTEQELR